MERGRKNSAAAVLLAVAAVAALAAEAAGAGGTETPVTAGNNAAEATSPTAFTLSTPMLRSAVGIIDPAATEWTERLPEIRLKMDSASQFNLRDPATTLGGMGVRGFEFALPRVPGLWVGVEEPEDIGEFRRATLSIQKQF